MNQIDFKLLHDILEQINEAENFVFGYDLEKFMGDSKTRYAVVKAIEIIGEASNRLSEEFTEKYSDFPVHELRGMRNRLIHGYDKINFALVYQVTQKDLPELKKLILEFLEQI